MAREQITVTIDVIKCDRCGKMIPLACRDDYTIEQGTAAYHVLCNECRYEGHKNF